MIRARKPLAVISKTTGKPTSWRVDVSTDGEGSSWESFLDLNAAKARMAEVNAARFALASRSHQDERRISVPLDTAVAACLERFENPNTRKAYTTVQADLKRQGITHIDQITKSVVYAIIQGKPLRRKSIIKKIVFIDLIIQRAKERFNAKVHGLYERIDIDAGNSVVKPVKSKERGFLTREEIAAILSKFDGKLYEENKLFWTLLSKHGFRIMELAELTWGDIQKIDGHYIATVQGKGGDSVNEKKTRYVQLPEATHKAMQDLSRMLYKRCHEREPGAADTVFIHNRNGGKLVYKTLNNQWGVVCRELGIDPAIHTPHALRRWACAFLYEISDFNERFVRSQCGWDSAAISFYINPKQSVTKSVMDKLAI
jgi:integrase